MIKPLPPKLHCFFWSIIAGLLLWGLYGGIVFFTDPGIQGVAAWLPASNTALGIWLLSVVLVMFLVFVLVDFLVERSTASRFTHEISQAGISGQQYLDIAGVIIIMLDKHGNVALINKKGSELLGYPTRKILGMNWFDNFVPEADRQFTQDTFSSIQSGLTKRTEYYQNPVLTKSGKQRIITWHNTILRDGNNQFLYSLSSGEDVTERIAAKNELNKSQERYQLAQRAASIGSWDWDITTGEIHWSEMISPMFGYKSGGFGGTYEAFLQSVHPDDVPKVQNAVDEALRGAEYDIEHRIVWPNGEEHWVSEKGEVIFNEDGAPMRMLGIVQDITRIKDQEKMIGESEARFRQLAENTQDVFWVMECNPDKITYVNPAFENLWGFTAEAIYKDPWLWLKAIHPDDREYTKQKFIDWIAHGSGIYECDYRIVTKDNGVRYVHDRGTIIGKSKTGAIQISGIVTDITERIRSEEARLAHERKQRDNLIQEVHHRIKNNLQGITGLLREKANQYPQMEEIINLAISKVQYIALVYGMKGNHIESDLILCEIVPAICKTTEELLGQKVNITVNLEVIRPVIITEDESVPIALILGELIHNAAKHSILHSDKTPVTVELETTTEPGALVRIRNYGARLPDNFDFENGKGLNSGLGIIKSLLPPKGVSLTILQKGGSVEAVLKLSTPILILSKGLKNSANTEQRPIGDSI